MIHCVFRQISTYYTSRHKGPVAMATIVYHYLLIMLIIVLRGSGFGDCCNCLKSISDKTSIRIFLLPFLLLQKKDDSFIEPVIFILHLGTLGQTKNRKNIDALG
jgi:hypothetical protein